MTKKSTGIGTGKGGASLNHKLSTALSQHTTAAELAQLLQASPQLAATVSKTLSAWRQRLATPIEAVAA